jgi:hypothetical protein
LGFSSLSLWSLLLFSFLILSDNDIGGFRVEGPWAGAVLLAAAVAEDNMSPSHPLPIRMQWRSSWWRHSYSHQLHQYGAYMVFNEMPKL